MADLGKAYVQIIPSADGLSGSISNVLNNDAASAGEDAGSKLGAKLVATLKTVITGAAIGKAITSTLNAGGALQQSFGGIETIYGDAADSMKQFASEAATAGISANTYAEQAVSFGASLKQAFGDDIQGAAEAANQAILDMADNSAKMGTDISAVQNAYQGFAKQNYTMLDNLKLGYGGTKTEMERLLKDAQELTGVEYNIDNLGDVYEAIHVIQEELGVSGVAAEEAASTFTGSFGSMKAAAENVLANLSLGEDITPALNTLLTSTNNFLTKNLFPMLGNILTGLLNTFNTFVPQLVTKISASAPQVMKSATAIVSSFAQGISQNLPQILTSAVDMIVTLVNGIAQNLPTLIMSGLEVIAGIVTGIQTAMPSIVSGSLQIITTLASGIVMNLPTILQKGIEIIGSLLSGMLTSMPNILSSIIDFCGQMVQAFLDTDWIQLGSDILSGIGTGIANAVSGLVGEAIKACGKLVDSVKSFFGIASPSKLMAKEVGKYLPQGIAVGIEDNMSSVNKAMDGMNSALTTQVSSSLSGGLNGVGGGFTQNVVINAPQQLSASEVARQTRNQTRQMVLAMRGV